jgi:hypothetical protein
VTGSEAEAAARLLERLLSDPVVRERFRRDPVGASREAGLDGLAQEMAHGAGKAMHTLDARESRSSLAGMFMAAAVEGVGVYDFSKDFTPHVEGIPEAVGQVISRVNPEAIAAVPAAEAPSLRPVAFDVPPATAAAAGQFSVIDPEQVAADPAQGHRAAAAVLAEAGTARAKPIDPAQYGAEGKGGSPSAETLDLLHNKHVTLDANGIADLKSGKMDPRVVSVMTAVSRDHDISVSATISDHDKLTSGGSVSNHYYGRAFDIATVDGKPVNSGNQPAQEVAVSLSHLDQSVRPTEIGSPWALAGPAYFSDAAHQNHIHVAFDDPITPDWKPPEQLAASGADGGGVATGGSVGGDSGSDGGDSSSDGGDSSGGDNSSDGGNEADGLEDPGGDTNAEADAESDGGDGEGGDGDNDSVSDDPSDEQENDENDGEDGGDENDGGVDGDHDDSSDSSDGSDSGDSGDGSDSGDSGGSGDSGDSPDSGSGGGGSAPDLGDVAYPGDNASKAQLAAWMGGAAQKRGLPPELPVMAGLVESGLRNINYGDADSVGFFQMRVGTWNQGAYAGYPDKPELQLKWFLDTAEAVKKQRIASGQPVDDPNSYGEWIADVERPAAQYRGRYQLRLEEAQGLLKQGAGSQLEPIDGAGGGGGRGAGRRAVAAVAEAKKYLGTPYLWGGSSPKTGFDCSGLMQWAYAKAGIQIPRTSEQQILASNGTAVDRKHLIAGDLVFFRDSSGDVHHVGMSLGGDKFIAAPHTGDVVKISSLNEPYYAQQFTGGRRFDVSSAASAQAAAASAPAVDPAAVRDAEAALARDAADVQRPGTLLFQAVQAQEVRKANVDAQFLKAVDPSGAGRA